MRNYNVYYSENDGKIEIVHEDAPKPADGYEQVGTLPHDNSNQSAQLLRDNAIRLVSEKLNRDDVGLTSGDVTFRDVEPYGHEAIPDDQPDVTDRTEQLKRKRQKDKLENTPTKE